METLNTGQSDRSVSNSVATCFSWSRRNEFYQFSLSIQVYTKNQYKNLKR